MMTLHHRGSALIFTLLIIGLVASLSFFIGRTAVREARIVTANQSTLGAYYAAEAGLEDGLARLAADHNIEVPTCYFTTVHSGNPNAPCDPTDVAGTVYNNNLSIADLAAPKPQSFPTRVRIASFGANGGLLQPGGISKIITPGPGGDAPLGNPNDYIYDLRITSRTLAFGTVDATGNPANSSANPSAAIAKDNFRDFVLYTAPANSAPDSLRIFWTCDRGPCGASDLLFYTIYRQPSGNPGIETTQDSFLDFKQFGIVASVPLTSVAAPAVRVRIKAGVNSHVALAFYNNTSNAYVYFKGDKARLQSIGYFAGVRRQLEADIDRNNGSLLGLFDYAVYAGNSFTSPQ